MTPSLVSIIIISYNHSKYIVENLDSVKNQTYKNIELIVADDASQDNSVEVFDKWLQENNYPARKIYHQTNTGLAATLNECMELIRGEYVKFIAADDFLHPESIEKCVTKLESVGEDFGMVFTNMISVNEKSEPDAERFSVKDYSGFLPEHIRKTLLAGNCISAPSVLMRTEALKSTGKYDPNILTEDYDRWLRISEKYQIAYIPENLVYYRAHSSNISKAKAARIADEAFMLRMKSDKSGIIKREVDRHLAFLKYNNGLSAEVLQAYRNYTAKSVPVLWYAEGKINLFGYRLLNKIFS